MRLIGIGLLAFVLAAAAFTLSYFSVGQQNLRRVTELLTGPSLVFETGARPKPSAGAVKGELEVTRIGADAPVLLSGLPAYQSIEFEMPVDARPLDGRLQVDLTAQALQQVEAVLRINVGNIRRAEVLLTPGQDTRSVAIPLNTRELAARSLPVSFSVQGRGPTEPCGGDTGVASVIEIESSTALHLDLDRPLSSVRDLMIGWGGEIRAGWSTGLPPAEQVKRLSAAVEIARNGRPVVFLDARPSDVIAPETFLQLAALAAEEQHEPEGSTWPIALATGQNEGLRRFKHATSWRTRFALPEMTERRRAVALELDMLLGTLPPEVHWTISATLNGRTAHLANVPGGIEYSRFVTLPADWQLEENTLEISAVASINPEGACNEGPVLVAELREGSRILGGGPVWRTPVHALQERILASGAVELLPTELSAPEAEVAADLLAEIIPDGVEIGTEQAVAIIEVIGRGKELPVPGKDESWVVLAADDPTTGAQVLDPEAAGGRIPEDAPVALRVRFPRNVAYASGLQ